MIAERLFWHFTLHLDSVLLMIFASWVSFVVSGALKLMQYLYAYSHSFIISIYRAQAASRRSEKGNYE